MTAQWWAYVQQRARGSTQKDIAEESGIDQTVLSRWQTGKNPPSAQKVVQFARGIGRPPVEALVAAGYLTEKEAIEAIEVHRGLDTLTDDELLAEVRRRMKGARHVVETAQESDAQAKGDEDEEVKVVQFPDRDPTLPPDINEPGVAAQQGTSEGRRLREQQDRDAEDLGGSGDDDQ